MLEQEAFDVDGTLVRLSRRVTAAHDTTPSWSALDALDDPAALDAATVGVLETEVFTTEASFDALGRPVTQTTPDASVLHLGYGDAGHLETVAANVRGDVTATGIVDDLRYDAKGRRKLVVHGNGTQTSYEYDPRSLRLTRLRTERVADGHLHQDLRYSYDPVGNVTEVRDGAQPVVFTSNAAVSADQRFEYDALYRVVQAEGREHGSQGQPQADDFVPRAAPDDPTGLRAYTEQYLYDVVGNLLRMQHAAVSGSWTRHYDYDPSTHGNRLLGTSAPGDAEGVFSHGYTYDAHGSMTSMPHLAAIEWDWANRMTSADLGGGGTVHFGYDASGQRVRKVRTNLAGTSTWERLYLGGFELYRERVGGELRLERQTLHIADDSGRVCMVETKTVEEAAPVASPSSVLRYQVSNHLGSVGMELDGTGQLISYEELHPYGTTAYRAANGAIEVSPSRYRYTGKERDEETGLGYHGARYYASWLGRWTAADPIGLGDGVNRFAYVRNSPTGLYDPSGTKGKGGVLHEDSTDEEIKNYSVLVGTVEGDQRMARDGGRSAVAKAVHGAFEPYAQADNFSAFAVEEALLRYERDEQLGFRIRVGEPNAEGNTEIRLQAPIVTRLAREFEVPLGDAKRLFPELAPILGGEGTVDAPEPIQKIAELGVLAGTAAEIATGVALLLSARAYLKKKVAQAAAAKGRAPEQLPVVSRTTQETVSASASRKISSQGNVSQAQRKMQRRQSDPDRGANDPFAGVKPKEADALVKDIVSNADLQISGSIKIGGSGVKGISGSVLGRRGSIIFRGDQGVLVTDTGEFITFIDKARPWPLRVD